MPPAWLADDGEEPVRRSAEADPGEGVVVPEWAEDSVLDRFFASWTPGPPPDAPRAELRMVELVAPFQSGVPDGGVPGDGNGNGSRDATEEPPATTAATGPTRRARADDDVFPGARRRDRWGRARGWYRR